MRNILLIEPNYKNKYPPIGLMKIATYHKLLGDNVTFYKGNLKDLVVDQIFEKCYGKLKRIDNSIAWRDKSVTIKKFIKSRRKTLHKELAYSRSEKAASILRCLNQHAEYYRKKEYENEPVYDRVYVTTLFTFYWQITIDTIEFAKKLVKKPDQLLVGGVMASLLAPEIEKETGIKPISGLLDTPGILDKSAKAKKIIIDDLPLDYSILDEIEYKYPTQSAYFTFMTKGCTRKCSFCSVPKLEPTYKPKIETISKFSETNVHFGEQRNLLLMDNNVLASPKFPEIIQEIKDMGFAKGAAYKEPNQLDIGIRNLRSGYNDRAYINRCFSLIYSLRSRLKKDILKEYDIILKRYELTTATFITKQNLLRAYKHIAPYFEKYRIKSAKRRYVDFNQGTDARYVTDETMRLMSEIPIRPLRIAFDYIGLKKVYINAVELAAKYDIKELSNYILYNFNDTPDELYERLLINVDLSERLGLYIYSFPMKFIPLFGEEAKDREFVSANWNKKFVRAIQSILNVTRGIVPPGRSLFERAFGRDINEFRDLLYMPEQYIVYRHLFDQKLKYIPKWKEDYHKLLPSEKQEAQRIICLNNFNNIEDKTDNIRIRELLRHYTITWKDIFNSDSQYKSLKRKYDKLITKNQHHNLTLTYDFERRPSINKPLSSPHQKVGNLISLPILNM